ncbi:hypothetical protein PL415_02650, partial [Barnesiella intestinihominis]|nr:hypothetical protein [Barnesiella intestinihominis]
MDSCSKEKRSEIMSKVKRKDTRPEIQVRNSLVQKKPTSSTRCKGKVQVWSSRLT